MLEVIPGRKINFDEDSYIEVEKTHMVLSFDEEDLGYFPIEESHPPIVNGFNHL